MKIAKQNTASASPRRIALHGLIIAVVMIGIGVGATYAVFGGVLDNLGSMTGGNKVIIESVNAYTSGDRMVITGNIRNIGTGAMTSVVIDEITAGDLVITQSSATDDGLIAARHGALTISGQQHDGSDFGPTTRDLDEAVPAITAGTNTLGWAVVAAAGTPLTDTATVPNTQQFRFNPTNTVGGATADITGFSTDENVLEALPAGDSQSFRVVITGISSGANPNVLDILRSVPAGSDLFITVSGTDGQSSTISDVRTATIKQR